MTTLSFDIIGRDRSASKTLTDVSKSAEKTSASLKNLKVAAGVGLVAVTAAAVKFGVSSVKAYSEAQTAQNKLQDAFDKFPRLADTNITALRGLNTALAQKTRFDDDATASGQAVLAQFKLTGQQITQLTPLLQDYAAKTGKDLPTAARDLGKAMLGQGRSLKAVGIDFKDTGTAGGNFAEIMGGLRTQVGGFATKEGKTAAGQAEILKNQFGELEESAGKVLLPALLKVSGGLLKVVNGFLGLSDASKTTILSLGGGIVTVGLAALAIGKLVVTVKAARDAWNAFGIASKRAVVGIPVIGLALAAVGAVIGFFVGQAQKAKDRTEAIGEALHTMTGEVTRNTAALDQNVRASTAKALQDAGALTAATKLGIGLDTLTSATLGNQTAIAEVHAKLLAAYRDGNSQQVQAASKLSGSFGSVSKSVGEAIATENQFRDAAGGAATASDYWTKVNAKLTADMDKLTAANQKQKAADDQLKAAIQGLINKFTVLNGGALSAEQRTAAWEAAIDGLTASVKTNGRSLSVHTEKGRANRAAIVDMITALNDEATATFKSTYQHSKAKTEQGKLREATAAAKRVVDAGKISIDKAATANHVNTREVHNMTDAMLHVPKKVTVPVTTPGLTGGHGAIESFRELQTRISKIKDKTVRLAMKFNASADKATVALFKHVPGSQASGLVGVQVRAAGGPIQNVSGRGVKGKDTEPVVAAVGEHMWTAQETDAVGGHGPMHRLRKAALRGELKGYADGGAISRYLRINTTHNAIPPASANFYPRGVKLASELGSDAMRALSSAARKALNSAIAASMGGPGGPIGGKGYAAALAYARRHKGHPYIFGTLWDCSGFMSALHSIILGQSPHRRYSTPAFHGAHAAGFTRGKRSPFMVGVRPLAGKFGHMAGTLNGVNVESAGGVGVRVGGSARGYNNRMFSWRGGLAEGGPVRRGQGDLPFDLLDPQGQRYNPELADLLHKAGYHKGGSVGKTGPERILSPVQNRNFEDLVRVMDRRGGAGVTVNQYVSIPHYVGSVSDLKRALVDLSRRGELAVIQR